MHDNHPSFLVDGCSTEHSQIMTDLKILAHISCDVIRAHFSQALTFDYAPLVDDAC